jgi:hypothetical protein
MLIQCLIRRKGGTVVEFDERSKERLGLPLGVYHFKPRSAAEDAPHVADVKNPAHIDHFLTIRTFKVLHEDDRAAAGATAPALGEKQTAKPEDKPPAGDAFDAAGVQKLSVRELRDLVESLDAEQVRAVLQLEQEDETTRTSVVDILMARLRKLEGQ